MDGLSFFARVTGSSYVKVDAECHLLQPWVLDEENQTFTQAPSSTPLLSPEQILEECMVIGANHMKPATLHDLIQWPTSVFWPISGGGEGPTGLWRINDIREEEVLWAELQREPPVKNHWRFQTLVVQQHIGRAQLTLTPVIVTQPSIQDVGEEFWRRIERL